VLDDGVIYDTQAPWPDDASANGQSIQRLSPTYWGSAPYAWVAASPSPADVSFSIAVLGDVTGDGEVTADDIDTLLHVAAAATTVSHYDVNNDGTVDDADVRFVVQDILGTFMGDVNLDGRVDSGDLNSVGIAWRIDNASGWRQGDVTGDGHVNSADLNVIGLNWQSGVAAAAPAHGRVPRAPLQAVAIAPRYAVNAQPILADRALISLGSYNSKRRERLVSPLPVSAASHDDLAERPIAFERKHRIGPFRGRRGTSLEPNDASRQTKVDADKIEDIDAFFAKERVL
jgi:hypothetical protein